MCIIKDGSHSPIPENANLISDNRISAVYQVPWDSYWKRSIPYLVDNEQSFLAHLKDTGFVPLCRRVDKYTLEITQVEYQAPGNPVAFCRNVVLFRRMLAAYGVRHGDLSANHVIPTGNNWLKVIDWAESRWATDPAPSRRPGTDWEQLSGTVMNILKGLGYSELEITVAIQAAEEEGSA